MSTSTNPLLVALIALLKADAPYMATIPGGLFDGTAPRGTAFPYTILGAVLTTPEHTHDKHGHAHLVTFHDYSDLEGRLECLAIANARHDALEDVILVVAGWPPTSLQLDFEDVSAFEDPELKRTLRRGEHRYRVSTLEI